MAPCGADLLTIVCTLPALGLSRRCARLPASRKHHTPCGRFLVPAHRLERRPVEKWRQPPPGLRQQPAHLRPHAVEHRSRSTFAAAAVCKCLANAYTIANANTFANAFANAYLFANAIANAVANMHTFANAHVLADGHILPDILILAITHILADAHAHAEPVALVLHRAHVQLALHSGLLLPAEH